MSDVGRGTRGERARARETTFLRPSSHVPRRSRWIVALALIGISCGPPPADPRDYRAQSEHYQFRVSFDPRPPYAREKVRYKVVVTDKDTQQPISNGEGQLFATSKDRLNTYDALEPGKEIGTYYANIKYMTAGQWAVAIRFRSDSTKALERIDWQQEVMGERASPIQTPVDSTRP